MGNTGEEGSKKYLSIRLLLIGEKLEPILAIDVSLLASAKE